MAARACEVIGLGARVAKIKQVCSVTTRGGERERKRRERGERDRRREGSAPLRTETIGGELTPLFLRTPTAGSGEWRKKKKESRGDSEREEKKREKKEGEGKEAPSLHLKQKKKKVVI